VDAAFVYDALIGFRGLMLHPGPRVVFAVGTPVTRRPPHRSQRAALPHWAPALGPHAKTLVRIRMTDAGYREPCMHVAAHARPADVAFLTPP
jgi:hypothetical protein